MKTNDSLRRLRYILDYGDHRMAALCVQGGQRVPRERVTAWLLKEDAPGYEECSDLQFAAFLNGLIAERRGKQDGKAPVPEARLTNNIVFRKLKIAFNLQSDDILTMLAEQGLPLSKHELSAFFRRPEHKHYRACKDQVLRNFLSALQARLRGAPEGEQPN